MKYVVLEFQTSVDGTVAIATPATFDTLAEAESKYHLVLSYAAVSTLRIHAAMLVTSAGDCLMQQAYEHPAVD